jgi:hypothetical protein
MTHFPTLHAMGRRRNVKHAPKPSPKPTPQWPSSATVRSQDNAGGDVQRDQLQRLVPTTQVESGGNQGDVSGDHSRTCRLDMAERLNYKEPHHDRQVAKPGRS